VPQAGLNASSDRTLSAPLASTCFDFEADFTADLRCIPMAVRRKLDLAGVKLKLQHWSELDEAERAELLAWAASEVAPIGDTFFGFGLRVTTSPWACVSGPIRARALIGAKRLGLGNQCTNPLLSNR
jgi:hypothetical protein